MDYSKTNTDNNELNEKIKQIEKDLKITLFVALEMGEAGIYPVLKYTKK